jgi:ATP-dependent DNA ligase
VTLYSRPGNDFTRRFPPIARALTHLRCRSCIIDGEQFNLGSDFIVTGVDAGGARICVVGH